MWYVCVNPACVFERKADAAHGNIHSESVICDIRIFRISITILIIKNRMKHESGSCPVDICGFAFFERLPSVVILYFPAEFELSARRSCRGSSARKLPVSLDPVPFAFLSLINSECMLRQVGENKREQDIVYRYRTTVPSGPLHHQLFLQLRLQNL